MPYRGVAPSLPRAGAAAARATVAHRACQQLPRGTGRRLPGSSGGSGSLTGAPPSVLSQPARPSPPAAPLPSRRAAMPPPLPARAVPGALRPSDGGRLPASFGGAAMGDSFSPRTPRAAPRRLALCQGGAHLGNKLCGACPPLSTQSRKGGWPPPALPRLPHPRRRSCWVTSPLLQHRGAGGRHPPLGRVARSGGGSRVPTHADIRRKAASPCCAHVLYIRGWSGGPREGRLFTPRRQSGVAERPWRRLRRIIHAYVLCAYSLPLL